METIITSQVKCFLFTWTPTMKQHIIAKPISMHTRRMTLGLVFTLKLHIEFYTFSSDTKYTYRVRSYGLDHKVK